ncbi:MAG: hypothetical protein AAF236_06725 [Verrucomicrobiota bacterium]
MKPLKPRERTLLFVVLPIAAVLLAVGYFLVLNKSDQSAHPHSHSTHSHSHD